MRVSVIDDGCGIDPDTLTHVWEPFFTTKPPGEGSGLGLATVYGIARQAGGGVAINSTVGRGTRIDVYIPATDRRPDDHEAHREPEASVAGARILLVEDEASVRDVVRRILERAGYSERFLRRGCAPAPGPVLTKPFQDQALLRQVASLIGAHRGRNGNGNSNSNSHADEY